MTATTSTTQYAPALRWPPLPLAEWRDTYDTIHLWVQIVGKTRLALAPMRNHWWQVALYVTSRGLTTSPIAYGGRSFTVDFDFLAHQLVVRTSDDVTRTLPLVEQPVAEFYREYLALLRTLGIEVHLYPHPVEIADTTRFPDDFTHAAYDADAAQRCWRVLGQTHRVLEAFQGRFLGKCSPVHFWWGSFDIACTRFSGRVAPTHPGGIPNTPDYVTREAYSHECSSAGWWPGGGLLEEPAFYAYTYPEPRGVSDAPVSRAAYWHPGLRIWILPYDSVREASDPEAMVMGFLQRTYEVGADLAGWDRAALERQTA